jgi:hypothetical protein
MIAPRPGPMVNPKPNETPMIMPKILARSRGSVMSLM